MNTPSEYNKQKKSLMFEIYELYLFTKTGSLVSENIRNKNIYNTKYYKRFFPNLIKVAAICDKKSNKAMNHNIYFLKDRKIMTVNIANSNIISLAVYSNRTKSKLIYFFLLEVTMAFLNYMKMHNCHTSYNIHSIIYETFLLSPIKSHFSLAIREIFRRYTLYINNIGYKNYYLVDLTSNEIILSLESLYDHNTEDEVEMKIPNKIIWDEVLYHSHILKRDYIKKNNSTFEIENLQDFYVKIEFKSTYPRLIYIIKFLPLLGGMVLIHEYTQTKMSRIDGENTSYREFQYEYGYQFDDKGKFRTKNEEEFLLKEPDVLIHIHFFIIECLLCNLNNIGFFDFKKFQKIYFSHEILKLINKLIYSKIKISQATEICSNPKAIHQLLEKIANNLYEEYVQINAQEVESKESAMIKKKEEDETSLNRSFYLEYPDSLYITKKLTLKSIFKSGNLDQYINPNDISLDLSTEEESPIIDNIYQALREKNEFNQYNDPHFYYRYHYAHASVESQQLMDLLRDNVSLSENEILLNLGKNNMFEPSDLMSLNVTDFSSRKNLSKRYPLKPTIGINNYNIYHNDYLNNKAIDNLYNISSTSSQIRPMIKINK